MSEEHFTFAEARAKVGKRITTLTAFSGVPRGTKGRVVDCDRELVAIQWDLSGRGKALVDWFSKWEYEKYLEEFPND